MKRELAEIFVTGENDPRGSLGRREQERIRLPGHVLSCPQDVMAIFPKPMHGDAREILVCQEQHRGLSSGRRPEGDHAFRLENLAGIIETRRNVIMGDTRIVLDDLLL
jgi:hypothetical protein